VYLFLTFRDATVYSYCPVLRSTELSKIVLLGYASHPSIATCNSSNWEDIRGTCFHFKCVRLEVGVVLKVMISSFRKVKACRLVMYIKTVVLLQCISWRPIGAVGV
jgi:hypothetical protein